MLTTAFNIAGNCIAKYLDDKRQLRESAARLAVENWKAVFEYAQRAERGTVMPLSVFLIHTFMTIDLASKRLPKEKLVEEMGKIDEMVAVLSQQAVKPTKDPR